MDSANYSSAGIRKGKEQVLSNSVSFFLFDIYLYSGQTLSFVSTGESYVQSVVVT